MRALPPVPPHAAHTVGAIAVPCALAREFELTVGEDPRTKEIVDAHVVAVVRMFFPELVDTEGGPR